MNKKKDMSIVGIANRAKAAVGSADSKQQRVVALDLALHEMCFVEHSVGLTEAMLAESIAVKALLLVRSKLEDGELSAGVACIMLEGIADYGVRLSDRTGAFLEFIGDA